MARTPNRSDAPGIPGDDQAAFAELIAARVVALLRDELPPTERLLTVAEFARLIGRSTDYCRQHALELGGIRQPTTGKRILWRFPATTPTGASAPPQATAPRLAPAPRRARPSGRRAHLLPVKGRAA